MPGLSAALARALRRLPAAVADADLVRAYAAGRDPDAFRALVARHGPLVLGVCRRVLGDVHAADDAFQATFLVLARRAGSVRRPAALAAWLFGVARRIALKARTAQRRRARRETRAVRTNRSAESADELTARELLAALDAELLRLPAGYREPLVLCYWQGLTQDEAARRLGCSPGAVKGRLERGRAQLAERLRRRGFGPAALLLAPIAAAAVPADLLARTAGLAAAPWGRAIPAAVLALAGGPARLVASVAVVGALAGIGLLALAAGAGPTDDPPKPPPAAGPAVDRFGDPLPQYAVARLGTLRYRSDAGIAHPVVLPDGRHVAFAASAAVAVMDLDTGQTVRRITRTVNGRVSTNPITAFAIAPDGGTMAVGVRDFGADGKTVMSFWLGDVTTGTVLREFAGRDRPVRALAFLAGGRHVAALDDKGIVSVWEAKTGAKVRELTAPDRKLVSLAASADGRALAAGGEAQDGTAAVFLWDAATGQLRHTLAGHTADVKAVAFAPEGRTLASGGSATVRLWDVATGRELRQLHGHVRKRGESEHAIESLAFSPDSRAVASASTDGTVRVWSVADGQALDVATLAGLGGLAFRDGRTLLVGSGTTLLRRDVAARSFAAHDGPRWHMGFLAFTADGRTVVTADPDSTVRTWDAADGRLLSVKVWSPLTALTLVSPDGRWVAFTEGESQFTVCVGDVASGRVAHRLPDRGHIPVAVSADGRRLATLREGGPETPEDMSLAVWDAATGGRVNQFRVGWTSMGGVALSPDGRTVFTVGMGQLVGVRAWGVLRRWDVATGRVVWQSDISKDIQVYNLTASAGGRRLAGVCQSGPLRVWDTTNGQECWRGASNDQLSDVAAAFSPDGSWLATASVERGRFVVRLRDARNGAPVADLRGHNRQVIRMAFSPDGRRLASTSTDGTALVWDVEAATGRRVLALTDPARQTQLWADLAGGDGLAAHAIDCLQAAPADAVAMLKAKLRPAVAVPADRVAPLVAGLDAPAFAAREQAQRDLAALGPGAEPAVRAARDAANAEVRRRLDAVLAGWKGDGRRAERAVEVLEYVGTPDARKFLAELAGGDPAARLTRAAKVALARSRP
ncbi:MAG TPA: sigma-70 family RNA polymerase sigma factor [Gemmataceae bacterium]|jgi:RNA polymerase sigma factor (sigma-70 family)